MENKIEPNFIKNGIYFEKYDTIIAEKQFSASKKYPLPIFVREVSRKEYTLVPVLLSEAEAKQTAQSRLNRELISGFSKDCEILNKDVTFSLSDKELTLCAVITANEVIGECRAIP